MKQFLSFGAAVLLLGAVIFTACKKTDDIVLPPIGGFNNSDEVGKADLLAHFPCEDGKERISATAPNDTKNATYATGFKGKSLDLAGGYVKYPVISALTSTAGSYSMSAWVRLKNNRTTATCIAQIARSNEWAGHWNLMSETGWGTGDDTLTVKGLLISKEGTPATDSWQDSRNFNSIGGDQLVVANSSTWVHTVLTWDATSSKFFVYANNKKVSNPDYEFRYIETNGVKNGIGDFVFNNPDARMVLGAFNSLTAGSTATPDAWQGMMTGGIDEVRVWKKALSAAEIDALYQLEKAGR